MKKSKPPNEETTTVEALGETEVGVAAMVVGEIVVVLVDVLVVVSDAADEVAIVVVIGVLVIAATEVGETAVVEILVVLAEGMGVVVVVVVVVPVAGTAMVVVAVLVEGLTVVTDEETFLDEAIFARRFFKKAMSSSPEIFCAKKMTQ